MLKLSKQEIHRFSEVYAINTENTAKSEHRSSAFCKDRPETEKHRTNSLPTPIEHCSSPFFDYCSKIPGNWFPYWQSCLKTRRIRHRGWSREEDPGSCRDCYLPRIGSPPKVLLNPSLPDPGLISPGREGPSLLSKLLHQYDAFVSIDSLYYRTFSQYNLSSFIVV